MNEVSGKDEKNWAMLCHLSALAGFIIPIGNILGPLFVWMAKREEFPLVMDQGRESLNFQISMTIYIIAAVLLIIVLIGIPLLIGLGIFDFIMVIIASIRAADGERYRYPLAMRLVQ